MSFRRSMVLSAAAFAALGFAGLVSRADITGSVQLDGKAPEMKEIDMSGVKECAAQHTDPVSEETVIVGDGGGLANVVVAIKADDPSALGGETPKEPAVLDQKGCQYVPHVLAMMAGQDLVVRNDDPFLHNVHSLAQTNPGFNFGQPNKDPGKKVDSPKVAETFKVKCDVHPWMGAWIAVFEHPFFAVTNDKGAFTIKGTLPDGDYTLSVWHEKFGAQEVKVSVKDGKGEVADPIKFKAEGAAAPGANPATPKLARVGQSQDATGAAVMNISNESKTASPGCCSTSSGCGEGAAKPETKVATGSSK